MSFSGQVKKELEKSISTARHCMIAELTALIQFSGKITVDENNLYLLTINTENEAVARKCFTLLKKTFNIDTDIIKLEISNSKSGHSNTITISKHTQVLNILQTLKYYHTQEGLTADGEPANPMLLKNACCKRAFLRGSYLAAGSMSDPEKSYHMEFVCVHEKQAHQLCEMITGFGPEAKMIIRKKYYVVYIKEGAGIVDLLNIMEAHISLMELENLRILKEMRNSINRRVNCEAANITKTVTASSKQTEDILYIRDYYGFRKLPENLREIAQVRLEYPEATLKELGQYLNPLVGKSGVNHRLRKLSQIADKLRM